MTSQLGTEARSGPALFPGPQRYPQANALESPPPAIGTVFLFFFNMYEGLLILREHK